ncbi:Glutamate-1-semialdehyde 2,1-aminomutase 1 [compost metagenome]
MERLATELTAGLQASADRHGIALTINRIRGAFSTHFCSHPVTNYDEAQDTDGEQFAAFFRNMLDRGINLAPSKYEAWFLTTAHTDADVQQTIEAAEASFKAMAQA